MVWGDSDSVATRPSAHPTEPGDAHDCFFRARLQLHRNRQLRHKPTQRVANGRKGCSHPRRSLPFNTIRFPEIPLLSPTPLYITCTSHIGDPTYALMLSHGFFDLLPSKPTRKAPTIMKTIQLLSPLLSQGTLLFLSSPPPLNQFLILTSHPFSFSSCPFLMSFFFFKWGHTHVQSL